jgi:TRAP-type uncharacterized transport system fused permease subunit
MGAAAFLMAEFLEMSYAEVVVAAAIPAALFYFALLLMADMDAARLGMAGLPPEEVPPVRRVLREGWYFAVPFAVLVFMLFAWNKGPAEAVPVTATSASGPPGPCGRWRAVESWRWM